MTGRILRPFQELGVDKGMARVGRVGFFVDMGLGKTPMASKVSGNLNWRRIVVACKDSGILVWKTIGKAWLEEFTGLPVKLHIMDQAPWAREIDWALQTPDNEVHVWLVVYNTFAIDMGCRSLTVKRKSKKVGKTLPPLQKIIKSRQGWDGIICDECQKINNKDSAMFLGIYYFTREHSRFGKEMGFLPLSGTPGDKGPRSFWSYLRIMDPKLFRSYWAYIEHFHIIDKDNSLLGPQILDQRLDTKPEWDRVMAKYFYVVREEDVKGERPPIERFPKTVAMTPQQSEMYKAILKDMWYVTPGADYGLLAENSFVQLMRLRQILVCPKILGNQFDCGGAIQDFCDELEDASEKDRHTVIFTPFKAAFEHFTTYLNSRGFPNVFWLHGGISANQQGQRIQAYRDTKGITLCTIDYAEAFSLEPANKAWFIGSSWSPDPNRQAEKRLLRLTSTDPVLIWYYTYGTPTDYQVVNRVCIKQENIDMSLPSNLAELLKAEFDQKLTTG